MTLTDPFPPSESDNNHFFFLKPSLRKKGAYLTKGHFFWDTLYIANEWKHETACTDSGPERIHKKNSLMV